MSNNGTSIICSTHFLEFVENLCDFIIVIGDKKITRIGCIKNLEKKEIEDKFLKITGKELDKKIEDFELSSIQLNTERGV